MEIIPQFKARLQRGKAFHDIEPQQVDRHKNTDGNVLPIVTPTASHTEPEHRQNPTDHIRRTVPPLTKPVLLMPAADVLS